MGPTLGWEGLKFIPSFANRASIPSFAVLFQRSVTGALCPAPRALLGIDVNLGISEPKEDGCLGREGEVLSRGSGLHSS